MTRDDEGLPPLWDDAQLDRVLPAALPNHRTERFRGEALTADLSAMAPEDAATARALYDWLGAIEVVAGATAEAPEARAEGLRAHLDARPLGAQLRAMQSFGRASAAAGGGVQLAKVIHDVRGGPLTSLFVLLQMVAADGVAADDLLRVHYRVRDHRKIMRGALIGLDPDGRARDRTLKRHDARLLVEKWAGSRVPLGGERVVRVRLDQRFAGSVCESCLELTALDRVLYNLINNAVRHARDGGVHVTLSAAPAEAPSSLRVTVANRVAPAEAEALRARFGSALGGLFLGGYSTTGSGLGLRICAEMIGHAYGFDEPEDVVEDGHLGAALAGEVFGAWAHWPLAAD